MEDLSKKKILMLRSKFKQPFEIFVDGTSMLPILHPGDCIKVCMKDEYVVGDIIVFFYKKDILLVHRLLKVVNGRYFCKGDNSFRLEDVEKEAIIGAVILSIDVNNTPEFITASYHMNRLFRCYGYSIEKTKLSSEYASYYKKYISENKCDQGMC